MYEVVRCATGETKVGLGMNLCWIPAEHKPGAVVHIWNPSTQEVFKVIHTNIVNLRPAWAIEDLI